MGNMVWKVILHYGWYSQVKMFVQMTAVIIIHDFFFQTEPFYCEPNNRIGFERPIGCMKYVWRKLC